MRVGGVPQTIMPGYLLPITYYLLPITYYLLLITYYLYYITCLFFQKQRSVRNV